MAAVGCVPIGGAVGLGRENEQDMVVQWLGVFRVFVGSFGIPTALEYEYLGITLHGWSGYREGWYQTGL